MTVFREHVEEKIGVADEARGNKPGICFINGDLSLSGLAIKSVADVDVIASAIGRRIMGMDDLPWNESGFRSADYSVEERAGDAVASEQTWFDVVEPAVTYEMVSAAVHKLQEMIVGLTQDDAHRMAVDILHAALKARDNS